MSANTSGCRSCGGTVSPTDRFCPGCGVEQSAPASGSADTVMTPATGATTCTSCGAPIRATDHFCPGCGASRLEGATVPSQGSLERITTDRLVEATTGEFQVLERIGHGAMGSVYLARDVALSRRVAIKVISPQLLLDESMVARFRLEAQTVAALRHPNIVNLHGVRQLGDLHYFIMDFIDGPPLRSLMKAHAPLEIPVVQALLFQVGSALSYAHRRGRGVIHRDVKPANIMVDREGHAVVMDFGISKVGASQSGLTQTGATIGTPEYMSPEQCMDKELSGASDQYALGIVAYEMLTGAVPFKGSSYAIMMAHASTPPPSIRDVRPDCPAGVEAAVMRMLAKKPEDRFPDLDVAIAELGGKPLGHGDPVKDRIIALAESVASDPAGLDESSPLSPVPASKAPDSITITGLPKVIRLGDAFDLRVESRGPAGTAVSSEDVRWTSSDPSVATVRGGSVVAHGTGSTSLTATAGPVANTVVLTVAGSPATVPRDEAGAAPPADPAVAPAAVPARSRTRVWIGVAALIVIALGASQAMARFGGSATAVDAVGPAPAADPGQGQLPAAVAASGGSGGDDAASGRRGGAASGRPAGRAADAPSNGGDDATGTPTAVTSGPGTRPSAGETDDAAVTRPRPTQPADPTVTAPRVASVRIEGGDRVLDLGGSAELAVAVMGPAGQPLDGREVRWASADESVAAVRGGRIAASGVGVTTVTATVDGVVGSVGITVEAPPPSAPLTRDEARAAVQRFIALLRGRDGAAVARRFGASATAPREREILDRMRENNFNARLADLGEVTPTADGTVVDFTVRLSWRDGRGAPSTPTVRLEATFVPAPNGWQLAAVRRLPDS